GENLKPNTSAQDVLQHGYGYAWEIDALFTALARAAGFEASMLGVSERSERSFNKILLWLGQLDGNAVRVNVSGREVMLDPGTPFCPYGMLRWKNTAVPALDFKPRGDFLATPAPQISSRSRTVDMRVSSDGSAKGELTVVFRDQEALEHR